MSDLYIRITRPEGYEDVHPDLILQDMGIDPVWGAEVVDVEAVLRECRKELNGVLNGKYSGNADRAIAKISGTSAARRGGSSPFLDTSDSR